ncbi:MAG: integration host factor subunit alpha [Desulfobulbaceae bacterium]|nr:integration host factor subunit alpha [Desulfobulbaceae bacterium]
MANDNITRKHLADAIHEQIGFSKQVSGELVDAFFDRLKGSLLAEKDVMLAQFGRFKVRQKSPRMGRNPKSGESIEISKRSMVTFKPSKLLRDKINRDM